MLAVPVIDVCGKSELLFNKLGVEDTKKLFLWLKPGENKNYPAGKKDDTHFQKNGAREIAKLVISGILELQLPLAQYIISDKL